MCLVVLTLVLELWRVLHKANTNRIVLLLLIERAVIDTLIHRGRLITALEDRVALEIVVIVVGFIYSPGAEECHELQ